MSATVSTKGGHRAAAPTRRCLRGEHHLCPNPTVCGCDCHPDDEATRRELPPDAIVRGGKQPTNPPPAPRAKAAPPAPPAPRPLSSTIPPPTDRAELVWEEPETHVRRAGARRRWSMTTMQREELQNTPGKWARIFVYSSKSGATSFVKRQRGGVEPTASEFPADQWEFKAVIADAEKRSLLYVRFIGQVVADA